MKHRTPERSHQRSQTQRHPAAGFTLVEMLVVLGIIGLVTALVGPQVIQYLGRAKTDTAKAEISHIGVALDLFMLDVGRYPTDREALAALIEMPAGAKGWNGPYLKKLSVPADPWGRPYNYRTPGQRGAYDLFTLGADNAVGGTGENRDTGNW